VNNEQHLLKPKIKGQKHIQEMSQTWLKEKITSDWKITDAKYSGQKGSPESSIKEKVS